MNNSSSPRAVLDACVLYPAALRDLLLQIAFDEVYIPVWSTQILDEMQRSILHNYSNIDEESVFRVKELMRTHFPFSRHNYYTHVLGDVVLPDVDDGHVVACAVAAKAGVVVTYNLRDFPDERLKGFGVRAVHPDSFLTSLYDDNPLTVLRSVETMRQRWGNPKTSFAQLLERLENKHGLTEFTQRLRRHQL